MYCRKLNKKMRRALAGEEYKGLSPEDGAVKFSKKEMEDCVFEDFMFRKIKTGDKIPFETYRLDKKLYCNIYKLHRSFDGRYIDKNETAVISDIDACRREFFDEQIEKIFGGNIPADYADELFKMFCKVLDFEGKAVDVTWLNDHDVERIKILLVAIMENRAQVGKSVARYLYSARTNIFIKQMTDESSRRLLQVSDINIIEYKSAVLSLFGFIQSDNEHLFTDKLHAYYEARHQLG